MIQYTDYIKWNIKINKNRFILRKKEKIYKCHVTIQMKRSHFFSVTPRRQIRVVSENFNIPGKVLINNGKVST